MSFLLTKKRHRANSSVNYQPLPWIGIMESRRTQGTVDRWNMIEPFIEPNGSLLDIGGNVGFFVFKAVEKGCSAWNLDYDLSSYLIGNYVRQKSKLFNAHFLIGNVDKNNINSLPSFDYILLLSVFHHWCAHFGFDVAVDCLRIVTQKAKKKVFFETGQAEMSQYYNVPDMGNNPQIWLQGFLENVSGKKAECLGSTEVFVSAGTKKAERFLFSIG